VARSGRGLVPSRRARARPAPAVPFLLAAPRARGTSATAAERRREELLLLWQELRPLEERAWAGALTARQLLRLQRLRVAYAARFTEPGPA